MVFCLGTDIMYEELIVYCLYPCSETKLQRNPSTLLSRKVSHPDFWLRLAIGFSTVYFLNIQERGCFYHTQGGSSPGSVCPRAEFEASTKQKYHLYRAKNV